MQSVFSRFSVCIRGTLCTGIDSTINEIIKIKDIESGLATITGHLAADRHFAPHRSKRMQDRNMAAGLFFEMENKRIWNVCRSHSEAAEAVDAIASQLGLLKPTAALLYNRGFHSVDEARRMIRKEDEIFHDPFQMAGMDRAVKRILDAVEQKQRIAIYGDYDVDGVTSVATLYLYLKSKGAEIEYYIPNRNGEGYGVNTNAIARLAEKGVRLIITVDTGITAHHEVEYARELGIDVLVTDHHECHSGLPDAVAVINCRRTDCSYPFKDLAGVGVVFKVICAVELTLCGGDYACVGRLCRTYADLVAIGTIADVMPLVDENRLIVAIGLKLIENTTRPGLAALLELSAANSSKNGRHSKKRRVNSSLIGYTIAPRLNAAGRISTASKAVDLFLTDSEA